MAGRCSSRFVEPPNAACTTIALRTAASVRMSRVVMPRALRLDQRARRAPRHVEPDRLPRGRQRARAAATGRAPRRRPARSPPCRGTGSRRPAMPQARQPSSAASSSVISPCAKRAPIVCTLPASSPSVGGSVTPPGTSTHGRSRSAASAIIIAGRPLSQVATPSTPLRVGSERISRRSTIAASLRYGEAVHHPGRALRAAVAGIGAEAGERHAAERASAPRPPPA